MAVNTTRRGPLRFEEGVATDTDIPNDFGQGAYGDLGGDARGRPFINRKDAEPDDAGACPRRQRFVDRGSDHARDFVIGASAGQNGLEFEMELGSERRLIRVNPARSRTDLRPCPPRASSS